MHKMSYKSVVWPANPETYREVSKREPVYGKDNAGNTAFTGMSQAKVTVTGSGAFYGADAYTQFKVLRDLFGQTGAGVLNHPVWGTMNAVFSKLELNQEPRADYVSYSFEFLGTDDKGAVPL